MAMQEIGISSTLPVVVRTTSVNKGWPQGHATLHSIAASKGADDELHGGGEMQLTSSGFSLSQILAAERVQMRMILHSRARRSALGSPKNDKVCTLFDETGQPLGAVLHAEGTPHLGPNEETVLLRRDN